MAIYPADKTATKGTVWDCVDNAKGDMWIVAQQQMAAYDIQQQLWTAETSPWVRQAYMVTDPQNAHMKKASLSFHTAYLNIKV